MKKPELVLIPSPGTSHLVSFVEIAKLLINRYDHLSITILNITIPKFSKQTQSLEQAASSISARVKFINLPSMDLAPTGDPSSSFASMMQNSKPHVKETVFHLFRHESNPASTVLAGFVLDMFCVDMIEIANEVGVPAYVYFTSGAAFLGSMFHFQTRYDELGLDVTEVIDSSPDLEVPTLANKFPVKVLPTVYRSKSWFSIVMNYTRKFRETKGIMVNTFTELESFAINSLSKSDCPTIYPVGPVLNTSGDKMMDNEKYKDIVEWLDSQPQESVVFLCFGSMGSFDEEQVKEIASALEQSGQRFLWSLRRPPSKGKIEPPTDYDNLNEVLPEEFLERTSMVGKVIGWAPQVNILAHKAVGGFVSHCGWNSTLESIWFGVPIAVWPMYSEQQFNAFQLVKDLGLATEIRMDYKKDQGKVVSAKEIENGIRSLLEDEGVKKRMKAMSEESRRTIMEGGSSYSALDCFIADVMSTMP